MRTRRVLWSLAAGLLAARASAIDVADGKLTIVGSGGWAYGRTGGDDAYAVGTKDGRWENAQFSLTAIAQPQDDVVVAGQLFAAPDGTATLDWAFGEYRVDDLLRVRAGKVKNPLGLFMEVKDVGTLRPFYLLPQSIYGPGGFGAEAYQGVGITGEWLAANGWGGAYDLYGGALSMPAAEPQLALGAAAGPPWDFGAVEVPDKRAQDVVGARAILYPPVEGLSFRASGFTGKIPGAGGSQRLSCWGVSAEWALDRVQVRGELFRATQGPGETDLAGYAEVAWWLARRWQVALRYEHAARDLEGVESSSPFLRHVEGAVGLSYWPSPSLVFRASYHRVDGNRFAVPALSRADGSVDARTDLFVAGAQFAF